MERALADAVGRFQRGERRFGLVVLDLDHFKDVNDQYGHAAGDAAIADLASILRFEMRRNDQVFRFGGEEFVALLELDGTEDLEAASPSRWAQRCCANRKRPGTTGSRARTPPSTAPSRPAATAT